MLRRLIEGSRVLVNNSLDTAIDVLKKARNGKTHQRKYKIVLSVLLIITRMLSL